MGRAHEVRAASMAKTNLAKSKLYSKYGKLIYMEARNGWEMDGNLKLKALVEKAKREQVPADVIKRNIEKAKGGSNESYLECRYEAYGPSGSTFVIECLTDNSNRTISSLKGIFGKTGLHLGSTGSVTYNYDYFACIEVKGLDEDTALMTLLDEGIEVADLSMEDDLVCIFAKPQDASSIKEALKKANEALEIVTDEVGWYAKDQVSLPEDDFDKVKRLFALLDDNDDVTNTYHNIGNLPNFE